MTPALFSTPTWPNEFGYGAHRRQRRALARRPPAIGGGDSTLATGACCACRILIGHVAGDRLIGEHGAGQQTSADPDRKLNCCFQQ